MSGERRLRTHWPFRRVAVVLSGGGALGAYQAGVLAVLERLGMRPSIVAGLSVGAINAVAWVAHDFRVAKLADAWTRVGPSAIGMRWTTLSLRLTGTALALFAALEVLLTVLGSGQTGVPALLFPHRADGGAAASAALEVLAWSMIGVLGWLLSRVARQAEDWLAAHPMRAPRQPHRDAGVVLLGLAFVHVATWGLGWPYPHRFSATVLVIALLAWVLQRPGAAGDSVRRLVLQLMPETGGRGLWRGNARRVLIQRLVKQGDPKRLLSDETHLIVNACAVDTGLMSYFSNQRSPSTTFRDAIARSLGEIVPLATVEDVVAAASASSSIPMLFQPVRIGGRDFVDAGLFSSQAIHAVLGDGADAVLVVLMSPAQCPPMSSDQPHLVEVGARLLELGNWRDLRTELAALPPPFSRNGDPARVCVVEPDHPLPGSLLRFVPDEARALMARGEADAWAALERAAWLEPAAVERRKAIG